MDCISWLVTPTLGMSQDEGNWIPSVLRAPARYTDSQLTSGSWVQKGICDAPGAAAQSVACAMSG